MRYGRNQELAQGKTTPGGGGGLEPSGRTIVWRLLRVAAVSRVGRSCSLAGTASKLEGVAPPRSSDWLTSRHYILSCESRPDIFPVYFAGWKFQSLAHFLNGTWNFGTMQCKCMPSMVLWHKLEYMCPLYDAVTQTYILFLTLCLSSFSI